MPREMTVEGKETLGLKKKLGTSSMLKMNADHMGTWFSLDSVLALLRTTRT